MTCRRTLNSIHRVEQFVQTTLRPLNPLSFVSTKRNLLKFYGTRRPGQIKAQPDIRNLRSNEKLEWASIIYRMLMLSMVTFSYMRSHFAMLLFQATNKTSGNERRWTNVRTNSRLWPRAMKEKHDERRLCEWFLRVCSLIAMNFVWNLFRAQCIEIVLMNSC